MDKVNVTVSGVLGGDQPFRPTREHLHQAMLALSYMPRQTVRVLLGLALSLKGIGLADNYYHIEQSVMCLSFIGLFLVYCCAIRNFW
jgi:hypothetical protein